MDVDSSGNVYVTGETDSSNFPTANAFQGTADPGGPCTLGPCAGDAFVAELDSTGANLLYSSYLGGQFHDHGNGIAVLSSNAVYVTGVTRSGNFAVSTNAFQSTCPTCGTTSSAFVTKLDLTAAGAAQLLYSSFLGEGSSDGGNGIALDSAGNAYIVGTTASTSFPTTTNCYQASNAGGSEAFLAKFDPGAASGPASLLYSTLLGGSNNEQGLGIAVDAAGKIYVTASMASNFLATAPFPTLTAFQTFSAASQTAFVAKVNPAGGGASDLAFSTYLGGHKLIRAMASLWMQPGKPMLLAGLPRRLSPS